MHQCPNCNNPLMDSNSKCSNCGYLLNNNNVQPYPNEFSTQTSGAEPCLSGFSIASMILGIISIPLSFYFIIGAIPAILSITFGFTAIKNIHTSFGNQKGFGMALTGIITGFCSIGMIIVFIIVHLILSFLSYIFGGFLDDLKNLS